MKKQSHKYIVECEMCDNISPNSVEKENLGTNKMKEIKKIAETIAKIHERRTGHSTIVKPKGAKENATLGGF